MSEKLGTFLVLAVYSGIVYTLVRPGSQGPSLVLRIGDSISNVIKAGMGAGQSFGAGK